MEDSVTLKVKDGYKNLRLRIGYDSETLLVLWNMDENSELGTKSLKIHNAVKYSKAGNYYIVVKIPRQLCNDYQKRLSNGEEVELSECTIEARGNDIFLIDGWSDSDPKPEPPARHPAADRPNKDVVRIPKDIILDVKPLRSKWNLKLARKEACNKYFTKEDLMTLEKVDGVKVDYIGDQLWIQYVSIVAGIQPKVTEDIYLDVKLGLITTKFDYNNGIVRIEAEDITDIESTPQEIERIDICGMSLIEKLSIATKPKTATFGITVYNPKLDKSECGGLMQSFHGSYSYLGGGNTELHLEFQTEDQTINWSNVKALIFDCKARKVTTVLGPLSLGADKLEFKFLDPQDSTVFPYEPYGGRWHEPKTIMVSSSCFTSDDRRKFEDAMTQQVNLKRRLLNSRYGITTSPADEWIRSGFDFDGDVVSVDKFSDDAKWIDPDYISKQKITDLINKRKGVKIMKKTEKTGHTVQEVFDTLTPLQRDTVYFLIGEAIKENSKGGATMAMSSQIKNLINEVIFDGPATIVKWADGTKTVVKAQHGEEVDREKGLALAMAKKFYGNDKNYFDKISMQVFGYNLCALMKKRGMKAKDIAEAMKENKVTVPQVELWMRGRGKINENRIAKLAKILGVKEEALFAAKDKKPSRSRAKKKTTEE